MLQATVRNLSRQTQTIILDHPAFLNRQSGWTRTTAKFGNATADGAYDIREVRRAYPGSLTLQAGESVSGLHPAIQKCMQVQSLVAQRVLAIDLKHTEEPASEQTSEDSGEK